jgi:hypothetical protein
MKTIKPDIVDNFSHEIIHGIARIDAARHIFLSLVRRCPYAGLDNAACKEVKEALGDKSDREGS